MAKTSYVKEKLVIIGHPTPADKNRNKNWIENKEKRKKIPTKAIIKPKK